MDDKNSIKDRILKDVGKSIKLIQQLSIGIEKCENYGSDDSSGGAVHSNSWLVQSLCCHLDLAFRHGLREPSQGFWPLLHGLSHSDTFQVIDGFQNICSPLGKGLIWLHHTLMEGSLQSYLLCLSHDNTTLRRYYTSKAILRDPSCTQQLLTLLSGLESISFNMNTDGSDMQEASGFSGLTSMTSSLSSPVDSGVALLDSDADVTSTNEATVTEGDSASLREEVALLPELEDNRINDHIVSQEEVKKKDNAEIPNYTRSYKKKIATVPVDCLNEGNNVNLDGTLKSRFVEEPSELHNSTKNNLSEKLILSVDCTPDFVPRIEEQKEILIKTQLLTNSSDDIASSDVNIPICNSCKTSQLLKSCCHKPSGSSRMTESCMGLIEGRNEKINIEPSKSDDSLNDNKWSLEPDVMSKSVGADTTVIRRQRKKKRNGPDVKVKRVSFHEDLLKSADSTSGFSASFLPPNPVIKCDVVKGRYSWCAEGDAPYFEQRKNENDTRSDVYLSASVGKIEADNVESGSTVADKNKFHPSENKLCVQVCEPTSLENTKLVSGKFSVTDSKLPPVTERGIPEGQEDPPKTSSLLHLNSITDSVLKKFPSIASSIDWSSDTESDVCDHRMSTQSGVSSRKEDRRVSSKCQSALLKFSNIMSPSKKSLLKKFMKSVTEKRNFQKKIKLQKTRPLYVSGAKPDPVVAGQTLAELETVYSDLISFDKGGCVVGAAFEKSLKSCIFNNSKEVLYRVFKVNSSYFINGRSEPLLVVLSENCIYFVGLQPNMSICLRTVMRYDELGSIIIGPSRQTLLFITSNRSKQVLVTSSNGVVTGEVVSHIEVAMRRSPMKLALPAVSHLELDNMRTLKLQLSKDVLLSDERLHHYSIINLQDNPTSPPSTPLGPKKEGHLMFRPATNAPLQPWEPGYFILKGGVVYMFSDQGSRLPKRVIPLHGGQCHGCRRIPQESRPHTFEILLGHKRSFQFAAADEYETSEWLQALVQSASGFFEMEQINTTPCSLIITSRHILACQEKFPSGTISVLTCAAITDLVSFGIVSTEDSWCVLEFACHEVHESSGDWAVYFSDSCEMLIFKQNLERLWKTVTQEEFPLQNITNTSLRQRCEETSHYLTAVWDEILLTDH